MKIRGLNELQRDLNKLEKDVATESKKILEQVVDRMIQDAKANAPRDLGRLIDSIDRENKDNGWTVVFFVGAEYAFATEFGTVTKVQVPDELKDVAMQFKGYKNGDFSEFLDNIKAWAKRKGIEDSAAYPIAMSILRKGINPQPYFYPAYLRHRGEIEELIKQKIDQCVTRINK